MAVYLMKRSGPSGPLVVGSLLAKTTVCNRRPNSKVDGCLERGWTETSSGHQSIGLRMLRVAAGIFAHPCTFGLTFNGTIRLLWVLRVQWRNMFGRRLCRLTQIITYQACR
eukprot:5312176-Pleurochrysis_carterae.AAC.1